MKFGFMDNEQETCGRKRSWTNLRYHPDIYLEIPRRTTQKDLTKHRQPLNRNLNPEPLEYGAGMLPI
jgi:hypothetical protein